MSTERLRLDKWLWHARFFKSRSLAAQAVSDAPLRVNGTPVSKPATAVQPGDVITFVQGRLVRVVRIEALGTRRGPAPEAQALYADLTPEPRPADAPPERGDTLRPEPGGRPTGRARRHFDRDTAAD